MFTASEIVAMTDNEIGTHASGGYGPKKRNEFIASVRRLALAETSHRDQVETAKGEISGIFGKRQHPGLEFGGDVA